MITTNLRDRIFAAIALEREHQDQKYGPVGGHEDYRPAMAKAQGPGGHELAAWCLVIEKELDEAKDAAIHGGHARPTGRNAIRAELVQIAAVCVAALEQHGLEEET